MNCDHCGKPVNSNAKFCGKCGAFLNFSKKIKEPETAAVAAVDEQAQPLGSEALEQLESAQTVVQAHSADTPVNDEPPSVVNTTTAEKASEHVAHTVEMSDHVEAIEQNSVQAQHSDSSLHVPQGEDHSKVETSQEAPQISMQLPVHGEHTAERAVDNSAVHQHSEHDTQVQPVVPAPLKVPSPESAHAAVQVSESVNAAMASIEQLAPVLSNSIPVLNEEFGASLDALQVAIEAMRQEMEVKVSEIKGDVHATAVALAQRIQLVQATPATSPDIERLREGFEQMRGEMKSQIDEIKTVVAASAQSDMSQGTDDMQAILAVEFKKIQTGIVNLYNTQQNSALKSTTAFDEALAALTFKLQNIENFVNSQLAAQAQSQSAAQSANRSLTNAVNEIKEQLREQEELLQGLFIDPALIKTMNSFNINFRKQQEQMANSKAQAQNADNSQKDNAEKSGPLSDTLVMWLIGFLCGLTLLLGGFSIYNYFAAQGVRAELHRKRTEDALKSEERSEKGDALQRESANQPPKKGETAEEGKEPSKEEKNVEGEAKGRAKEEASGVGREEGKGEASKAEGSKEEASKGEGSKGEGSKGEAKSPAKEGASAKPTAESADHEVDKSDKGVASHAKDKPSEKSAVKAHSGGEK